MRVDMGVKIRQQLVWYLPFAGLTLLFLLHWVNVLEIKLAEGPRPAPVLDFAAHAAHDSLHVIEARLSGRFANSLIIFAVLHRLSKKLGVQVAFGDYERQVFASYPNIIRSTCDAATVPAALKRRLSPKSGCSKYLQSYDLMRGMTQELQELMQPAASVLRAAEQVRPSSRDVAIHFRHFEGPSGLEGAHVTFGYFDTILSKVQEGRRIGRVLVMAEDSLRTHSIITRLRQKYPVELMPPDLHLQMLLARQVGIFVGSLGTLSYILALTTNASETHLPYFSALREGCAWTSLNDLFIYDDQRLSYHDLTLNRSFQSALDVIGNQTAFARGFMTRQQCLWDMFSFT